MKHRILLTLMSLVTAYMAAFPSWADKGVSRDPFGLTISIDGRLNGAQWPVLVATIKNASPYAVTYLSLDSPTQSYKVHVERRTATGTWQSLVQEGTDSGPSTPREFTERHGSAPYLVMVKPGQQVTGTVSLLDFEQISQAGDYRITATISLPDPSDKGFDKGDMIYHITGDMSEEQKQAILQKFRQMRERRRITVISNTLVVHYPGQGSPTAISAAAG